MKILTRAAQDMYVYLPAFKKVRRLASHVKEQGFMGTAFGHEEMSLVRLARSSRATSLSKVTTTGWSKR